MFVDVFGAKYWL